MNKDVYKMELHDVINVGGVHEAFEALRVPGGWIYTTSSKHYGVFVPLTANMRDKVGK